jgi:two-component system sensor histidine kinase and response regulator WspE
VVRALLLRVSGEVYALPLAHAGRVVRVAVSDIHNSEGRDYVELDGENVGVIRADEVLELDGSTERADHLTLVLLGEWGTRYGLVIDAALGEDDLVVRPLDPRLGRVPDVAATALLGDGSPTLLLDVADLMLSIEKLSRRRGATLQRAVQPHTAGAPGKRVLVVDDSLTVRQVQRNLLTGHGYAVDMAVDGVEAWSMLRKSTYDLAVVDVDMPRMNGLELVRAIRAEPRTSRLPVIFVSYKDSDADRERGMAAGGDQYLSKASLRDEQLVAAIRALIGEAQ